MNLTLDTIQNSQYEEAASVVRMTRGFVAADVDETVPSRLMLAVRAAALGVVATEGGHFPEQPNLLFTRILIRGFTDDGCFGALIYETLQGLQPSVYIIRKTTYTTTVETSFIPGTYQPIRIGWRASLVGSGDVGGATPPTPDEIPRDSMVMRFQVPTRVMAMSALVYGSQPTSGFDDYVGYVNSSPWFGKPAGHWMMVKYEEAAARFSGYYSFEAAVATRNFLDWSEADTLKSRMTQRYIEIDPAKLADMKTRDYNYGYIYGDPAANEDMDGIVRVGGNPMASFGSIFGI